MVIRKRQLSGEKWKQVLSIDYFAEMWVARMLEGSRLGWNLTMTRATLHPRWNSTHNPTHIYSRHFFLSPAPPKNRWSFQGYPQMGQMVIVQNDPKCPKTPKCSKMLQSFNLKWHTIADLTQNHGLRCPNMAFSKSNNSRRPKWPQCSWVGDLK